MPGVRDCSSAGLQVDDDPFIRKQGMFVLEHATAGVPATALPAWQALLQLLALLEDFALHLIKVTACLYLYKKDLSYTYTSLLCAVA